MKSKDSLNLIRELIYVELIYMIWCHCWLFLQSVRSGPIIWSFKVRFIFKLTVTNTYYQHEPMKSVACWWMVSFCMMFTNDWHDETVGKPICSDSSPHSHPQKLSRHAGEWAGRPAPHQKHSVCVCTHQHAIEAHERMLDEIGQGFSTWGPGPLNGPSELLHGGCQIIVYLL